MSGRMPFIDILLPYPHSGADTKYRLLNLFLFVLQICGYLLLVPIRCKADRALNHLRAVYQPLLYIRSRVQESNLSALHLPRHKNTARRERVKVRRCSECCLESFWSLSSNSMLYYILFKADNVDKTDKLYFSFIHL